MISAKASRITPRITAPPSEERLRATLRGGPAGEALVRFLRQLAVDLLPAGVRPQPARLLVVMTAFLETVAQPRVLLELLLELSALGPDGADVTFIVSVDDPVCRSTQQV